MGAGGGDDSGYALLSGYLGGISVFFTLVKLMQRPWKKKEQSRKSVTD